MKRCIFLSDVHLTEGSHLKTQLFVRFLQEVVTHYDKIFILGDLFDVWPVTSRYLVQRYKSVLSVLEQMVKNGQEVYYLEGNHDFHLGSYFSDDLGIRVFPNQLELSFGNRRTLLVHGDLGNPNAKGYALLRRVLRSRLTRTALQLAPSSWLYHAGRKSSQLSRKVNKTIENKKSLLAIKTTYRETARRYFLEGFDVVMMGHTHLPDDYRVRIGTRECRYLNTGDWVKNYSYVEFDGGEFYTRNHPINLS